MTKEKCNKEEMCVMCLMPKSKDTGVRENKNFCSYCFKNSKVQFEEDKKDFIQMCKNQIVKDGMNKIKASVFAWTINFAPWWKPGFDRDKAIRGK